MSKKINKLLRDARIKNKITQKQAGIYCELESAQYISSFETNNCNVSLPIIKKLCELYKLNKETIVKVMVDDYRKKIKKALYD